MGLFTGAKTVVLAMLIHPLVVAQTVTPAPGHQFELRIEQRQLAAAIDRSHDADHAVSTSKGRHKLVVRQGELVQLNWHSDEAVQLHLHGYDIELALQPGQAAVMQFRAHATGRFQITSHGFGDAHGAGHHHGLLYFEVHPQ